MTDTEPRGSVCVCGEGGEKKVEKRGEKLGEGEGAKKLLTCGGFG